MGEEHSNRLNNLPLTIVHVITGLNTGGAETMLYRLVSASNRARFSSQVISLSTSGTIGPRIAEQGIPVHSLNMPAGRPSTVGLLRLVKLFRLLRPDLIQGWMYHANLLCSLAAPLASPTTPVVWNIRQSLYNLRAEKTTTALVIRLNALLSRQPRAIIYNAMVSAEQHEAIGFSIRKRRIIPNGFDLEKYHPSIQARANLLTLLNAPDDVVIFGIVGRYHAMKDHANFVRAAGIAATNHPNLRFVMAGANINWKNAELVAQIIATGQSSKFALLDERKDVAQLMAGMDVVVSSSWTEAFPNVIGEAMACGVPCIVTDVGESAEIVGDYGIVVPPRDATMLANAMLQMVNKGAAHRHMWGTLARQRITAKYSLAHIVELYQQLYHNIVALNHTRDIRSQES